MESRDIYLGAIPWVLLQLLLVVVVIFVPQTVTAFLDKPAVVDLNTVEVAAPVRKTESDTADADKMNRLNDAMKPDEPSK